MHGKPSVTLGILGKESIPDRPDRHTGIRTCRAESSQPKIDSGYRIFIVSRTLIGPAFYSFTLISDEIFSVIHPDSRLLSFTRNFTECLFSLLSAEALGCIFYRNPMCSLSVVRNLNNKHTPSDILLLMFILHTFMGALSKSKMCWKWS